jgi:hypothetical protein
MSRLDDELKSAFRCEQPPADFVARVVERAALLPEPRLSWWRRIAMLLQPPKLRWIAIGVTASLLLAIGAVQYGRLHKAAVEDRGKVAETTSPLETKDHADDRVVNDTLPRQESRDRVNQRASTNDRRRQVHESHQAVNAEAEAAKEKLMLALSIASATLNEAEKAVHDEGPKP